MTGPSSGSDTTKLQTTAVRWGDSYETASINSNLILAYVGEHVLGLPRSS